MKILAPLLIATTALAPVVFAQTICINSGSLGVEGDATNMPGVELDQPGVVAAGTDYSSDYQANGDWTRLPFKQELNSSSPFTIEFWAKPTISDNDSAPVDSRIGGGVRSGWAFFQRADGWNFRMYNGIGDQMGFNLTGGPGTLNEWSHVVATWDGVVAKLYINGEFIDAPNDNDGQSATYSPSTTATLTIGALGDNSSFFNGAVDEVAFYGSALSAAKIAAHYTTVSSPVPGAYSNLVKSDGALVYYQQNPATIDITKAGENQVITFTGKLSQSTDLNPESWEELTVTSPYTVTPTVETPKQFFRASR
jgi:hypothetical protein